MGNRLDAEHLAFEEAARLVKEYRRKFIAARSVAAAAIGMLGGACVVIIWMIFH